MPVVTLPDGSQKNFAQPITAYDVCTSIGSGLAKAMLAARVDNKLVDSNFLIESDASLQIITARDEEGLEVIRHSAAHLLAQAVKSLYPEAQVTIGPVINDGFYYDFYYPPGFVEADLTVIETKMQELVKEGAAVTRFTLSRDDAIAYFLERGEDYKAEIIKDIPAGEELSLYQQGDFVDLCRGPHVADISQIKCVKLGDTTVLVKSKNEVNTNSNK